MTTELWFYRRDRGRYERTEVVVPSCPIFVDPEKIPEVKSLMDDGWKRSGHKDGVAS